MKTTSSAPQKKRSRKFLGFLIKAPLGCLGFLIGGGIVAVIFAPPSVGNLLRGKLEESFDERYAGSIEVEEAWVGSVYNDQRVEGLKLRDPAGGLVLSGALRAPRLWEQGFDDGPFLGLIEINLEEVNFVQGLDGVSNLERALTLAPSVESKVTKKSPRSKLQHINLDLPRELTFELRVARINWRRAGQPTIAMEDFVLELQTKREGWKRTLSGEGHVRLVGSGQDEIKFKCHWDDLTKFKESPWRLVFDASDVPVTLLTALSGSPGDLPTLFGHAIDQLNLKVFGSKLHERNVDLLLEDDGHMLDLRARWDRAKRALVASNARLGASVALPRNSAWAQHVLNCAVPLGDKFEMGEGPDELWMHFRDFELPLDGNLKRLQANCTFETSDVSFAYVERVQRQFSLQGRERLEESLHLSLRDGALIFDGLSLPARAAIIQLDGDLNLGDGLRKLKVKYARYPLLYLEDRRGETSRKELLEKAIRQDAKDQE
jgi:hypothetical protein